MGVHLNRDAGTRSERSQKQFVRLRARIIAAVRTWFVILERVRADGYVLDERHRSGIDRHVSGIFPLSICWFADQKKPSARRVPTRRTQSASPFFEFGSRAKESAQLRSAHWGSKI